MDARPPFNLINHPMKNFLALVAFSLLSSLLFAQSNPEKDALKININESGSHFFQATFLNQTWLRYNQSNPGTLVQGQAINGQSGRWYAAGSDYVIRQY